MSHHIDQAVAFSILLRLARDGNEFRFHDGLIDINPGTYKSHTIGCEGASYTLDLIEDAISKATVGG